MPAGYLYVDGVVGDVTHGVLRDRRVLADEGVVVVIVTVDVRQRAHPAQAHDLIAFATRGCSTSFKDGLGTFAPQAAPLSIFGAPSDAMATEHSSSSAV